MKLRTIIKRINRGLLLGVFCVIVLTVYLIADNLSFQNQQEAIKSFLTEFLDKSTEVTLLPEEYRKPEKEVAQEVLDRCYLAAESFVDEYYSAAGTDQYDTRAAVKNDLKSVLRTSAVAGTIYSNKITLKEIDDAKKISPRCAEIRIRFTQEIKYSGAVEVYMGGFNQTLGGYENGISDPMIKPGGYYEKPLPSSDPTDEDKTEKTQSYNGILEIKLIEDSGYWRVLEYNMASENSVMGGY